MATNESIFIVDGGAATNITVGAGASSAAQAAKLLMFALIATGDCHINFGDSDALADAGATNLRIPANTFARFDMGAAHTHFKVYNPGTGSITVQWIPIYRS